MKPTVVLDVYEVTYRPKRGGWVGEERLFTNVVPKEIPPDFDLVIRPLGPPGTLARVAYRQWHTAAQSVTRPKAQQASFRQRLELIRGLIARTAGQEVELAVHRTIRANARWLPRVPHGSTLRFAWAIQRSWYRISGGRSPLTTDPYALEAAWLSVLHGLWSGRLRLCGLCAEPFPADPKTRRTCPECYELYWKLPVPKRRVWEPVKERLRKRYKNPEERRRQIRQALEDLRDMPIPAWLDKWGQRDPRGRKSRR